jgi:hypothetical protein
MTNEWATKLETERAWVMHVPTHTIGRVAKFYEPFTFISPVNRRAVERAVIELEDGNNFIAVEESFIPLTSNEAGFFMFAQDQLRELLTGWVQRAAMVGIQYETLGILISASLRTQLTALVQARKYGVGGDLPSPPPSPAA